MTKQERDQELHAARMMQHQQQAQQQAQQIAHNFNMNMQSQAQAASISGPPMQLSHAAQTSDWERTRIMVGFKKNHPELAEFVEATARLLGYEVCAALSPFDAATFAGRNKAPNFVWRVHSRRWCMDVQWMSDDNGGGQDQWVLQFARLAGYIADEKAKCEKLGKPIPPEPPTAPSPLQNSLAQAQAYVNAQRHHAQAGNVTVHKWSSNNTVQLSTTVRPPSGFWKGLLGG